MALHDPMLAGTCIANMECGEGGEGEAGVTDLAYFGALGRDPVVHAAVTARCAPFVMPNNKVRDATVRYVTRRDATLRYATLRYATLRYTTLHYSTPLLLLLMPNNKVRYAR